MLAAISVLRGTGTTDAGTDGEAFVITFSQIRCSDARHGVRIFCELKSLENDGRATHAFSHARNQPAITCAVLLRRRRGSGFMVDE